MKNYEKPIADVIRLAAVEAIADKQPDVESGNGSDADF